ncbi:DDE-type integrase/transposase/recombinase [Hoyosella sp. YIM 151337]|uniref:DDE-type integrase/transposase/recombinase n=1 Tax=Hoyosella sp. YIM 151337 TaxID=2992742 RepID=UPI002235C0BF|nr:DDE-type integrase/transposase/recombinase [Hoyosella sp. YIM 151337]MCW4355961.1 DDE-type integrase/transposase/recombinase [Hoyosella sp. YIM 151337]
MKPIVAAAAPNALWTWDTTELRGPRNQDRYRLALILDVYSRYPVGWYIGYSENAADAKTMFTAALTAHGAPAVVHSDNGAAMRASELTSLLETPRTTPPCRTHGPGSVTTTRSPNQCSEP